MKNCNTNFNRFNGVVYINTSQARELLKEKFPLNSPPTLPTIIAWIRRYNFGYKLGGRWKINKEAFLEFLHGSSFTAKDGKDEGI